MLSYGLIVFNHSQKKTIVHSIDRHDTLLINNGAKIKLIKTQQSIYLGK